MSGYWRIQARYETVCARCRGYIKRGTSIVQEHGNWVHAVCPGDLRRQSTTPRVPTKYVEYHMDETGNLVEQEITL